MSVPGITKLSTLLPILFNVKTALANGRARPNQFKVFIPFPSGEAKNICCQ